MPGIENLLHGNEKQGITGMNSKIQSGKLALSALKGHKEERKTKNDTEAMNFNRGILKSNMPNFGYGYLEKPEDAIPPIAFDIL